MKKSDTTENLGSIVISKARGVPKSLFRVSTPKETEDITALHWMSGSLSLFLIFVCLRWFDPPGRRKGMEDKTYPAMDLLIHGEFDGASCILVEDYIRTL